MLLVLLLAAVGASGQSKKTLEERRKKLIKEIELTDKLLQKTTRSREITLDQFMVLQNQIERREKLLFTMNKEVEQVNDGIIQTSGVIYALEDDLNRMKQEYGRIIRNAFRRKMQGHPLLYILSAPSLNQAFLRWLYLRKYDRYRKQQAEAIAFTQQMLLKKLEGLEKSKQEKEALLASLQEQKAKLEAELKAKDSLLKKLAKNESSLKADLKAKQEAHEELNKAIEKVIQEEVRKQIEASRKPKASAPANPSKPEAEPTAETAAADAVTREFRKARGRLPWPVENGFISRKFGRQKHPTLKSVEITNNGIDIRTEAGEPVRSIHDGVVAGVQFIPGHDYTVILQHGEYYTVYSNLSETNLSKGDSVRSKQVIGKVNTNPIHGVSELHFELWNQKERQNPASWIRR